MWFDPAHVETIRDAFPEWLAFALAFVSHLGSVWFVAPAVVLAFWFWDPHRFAPWIAIVIGAYAVMVATKGYFGTPRPGVDPVVSPDALPLLIELVYAPAVEVTTTSFPSGHAIAAVVVWTMLALESDRGTLGGRLTVATTVVALVSLSRIVVGVHYPLDVIVGTAVGVVYVGFALGGRHWLSTRVESSNRVTSAMFALSGLLALAALVISDAPDAAALFGGVVGGLLGWQYATPPKAPWAVTPAVLVRAVAGIGLLALAAAGLIALEHPLAWFVIGVCGGATVLGLPRLYDDRSPERTRWLFGAADQKKRS